MIMPSEFGISRVVFLHVIVLLEGMASGRPVGVRRWIHVVCKQLASDIAKHMQDELEVQQVIYEVQQIIDEVPQIIGQVQAICEVLHIVSIVRITYKALAAKMPESEIHDLAV